MYQASFSGMPYHPPHQGMSNAYSHFNTEQRLLLLNLNMKTDWLTWQHSARLSLRSWSLCWKQSRDQSTKHWMQKECVERTRQTRNSNKKNFFLKSKKIFPFIPTVSSTDEDINCQERKKKMWSSSQTQVSVSHKPLERI